MDCAYYSSGSGGSGYNTTVTIADYNTCIDDLCDTSCSPGDTACNAASTQFANCKASNAACISYLNYSSAE